MEDFRRETDEFRRGKQEDEFRRVKQQQEQPKRSPGGSRKFRGNSFSLSPSSHSRSGYSTSSSSLNIIDDPSSASSLTTLVSPTQPREPEMVTAYNCLLRTHLTSYLKSSAALGDLVHEQAVMVESLFHSQRDFLLSSCRGNIPSSGSGPSQAASINSIQNFAKRHASSFLHHHLFYISDTIAALGWVVIAPYPAKFIRDKYENGHRHISAILSRDRPFHRDTFTKPWISSWLDLVGELEIYVNHFHPGGLKWNI